MHKLEKAAPLVVEMYDIIEIKGANKSEIARRSGVSAKAMRHWRTRHVPSLDSFVAVLNTIGFELQIVPVDTPRYTMRDVLKATAVVYDVPVQVIKGPRRIAHVCRARHTAVLAGHLYTDLSTTRLARAVGRSDHTTILHSIKKAQKLDNTDREFRNKFSELEERLAA